jgi:hypothetical protein
MARKKATSQAESRPGTLHLQPPSVSRQVRFHQVLLAARKQWFVDALTEALLHLDPNLVKRQISEYVPADVQSLVAAAGLRDEHLFPVPAVVEAKPTLVGYYRLLLGASQKSFYGASTGMVRFKSMEESGTISPRAKGHIADFCRSMVLEISELIRQIPSLSERDLRELPLLTYGAQLQGSNNTQIGKSAMRGVSLAVKEVVEAFLVEFSERELTIRNSAGRTVMIAFSHDPDIRIQEEVGDHVHHRVAIEVKGGTDVSNAHNRAGEAEKSHRKAKTMGFPEFWTIISTRGLNISRLQEESPTTNRWFDAAQILGRDGNDWQDFRHRLAGACGIPLVD